MGEFGVRYILIFPAGLLPMLIVLDIFEGAEICKIAINNLRVIITL